MCISVPVLLGFSPTLSVAAPTQTVAQASPRVGVNRPNLKVGSQGEPVSELQAALKLLGFYTGTVDGVYSESTAIAVSQFQQAAGLKPDGVVNATTWQRLFPSESVASSSVSSSNSESFPIPSQTSRNNTVVIPSTEQRTTTTTTTNTNNRAENLKPEPRPVTATTSRSVTAKPEPRPTTRVATSTSDKPSSRLTSSTRSGSSTSSRQATRSRQSTSSQSSNSRQTTRNQQSARSGSSARTQQIASLQYTSDGLPILRPGMRGSEVAQLQRRLQRLGYLDAGAVDGDFGSATTAAVISLQKRYGLEADGVVGGATWEILNRRRER
ncbi:hypothetical protein NUACC21_41000 [Scytonema sp. NUACC21]